MKLKDDPPVQYSNSELRLFVLLGPNPKNTTILTNAFYKGRNKPHHARQAVVSYLKSLDDKLKINGENCKVAKTKRRGPIPIEWTLVPRKLNKYQQAAMVRNRLKNVKKRIEAA